LKYHRRVQFVLEQMCIDEAATSFVCKVTVQPSNSYLDQPEH